MEGLEDALLLHAPSSTAAASFGGRLPWSELMQVVAVVSSSDCSGGNASVRVYSTLGTLAASRCPGDSFALAPRPLLSPPSRLKAVASLANMLSEIAFLGEVGGLSCLG